MSSRYDFQTVESKWRAHWAKTEPYVALNDSAKPKKYILVEFPFPSGASLHMGHLFRYTVPDIYARYQRHLGHNVLFPMGWDAFGLPAEEYARKTGQNPRETTKQNIAKFKEQINRFGFGIDWSREFATTDPDYYKWTQWLFKKFYEAGLAERREVELWYCPALGTVLANEEVYDGSNGEKLSERGDHPVERKKMWQWVLKITEYGDKLLDGLAETDFPEHVRAMQKSWIGRSEGTVVEWPLVPEDYTEQLAAYPRLKERETNEEFDYRWHIRERAALLIRVKGTDKYVAYQRVNDPHGFWLLPGGALDWGDNPYNAALRETREEVGLENVEYLTDLGSFQGTQHFMDNVHRSISHYFLGEISQEQYAVRQKAEVDDSENFGEYGRVELVSLEELRGNNWQELNKVLEGVAQFDQGEPVTAVVQQNRDILLGTTNQSKLRRFHRHLNFNGVHLHSPTRSLYEVNTKETGKDEKENAILKAKGYFQAQQGAQPQPVLALDTGIYLEGVPAADQPGKNTKAAAAVLETDEQKVIFEKMTKYYVELVNRYGQNGELSGYFLDAYALYDGFSTYTVEVKRPIIVTNQVHDRDDLYFPLCSLYKTKLHDKYHNKLSEVESQEFLAESMQAARRLLFNYVYNSEQLTPENATVATFTTRIDTLPSSTFVVLSPEYPGLLEMTTTEYLYKVQDYIAQAKNKSERERQINKEKSGVFTGRFVRNPITNELCPVWVSDFVLPGYGTGAVMGDAHDERDVELALQENIYLQENVSVDGWPRRNLLTKLKAGEVFTDSGILFGADPYRGLTTAEAKEKITADLEARGLATRQVNYRFRDWVFSRQRYWGEPFPVEYHGDRIKLVPDQELPLTLPDLENFQPSGDGRSPLADSEWLNIVDDAGNVVAKREADTMPNWAGSSWYYLRFCDPHNSQEFASPEALEYWLPVDKYFGGGEHTTMHLLYSRFWHRFLYDQGLVPTPEPYRTRINGGIMLGPDGSKMSKSKGNVIQPDEKLAEVGADALRLYIAFIGPYEATVTWQDGGLVACKRLVDTVWKLREKVTDAKPNPKQLGEFHAYLKTITEMLNELKTNTVVAQIMTLTNSWKTSQTIPQELWRKFLITLSPFAPHLAEELFTNGGTPETHTEKVTLDHGKVTITPTKQTNEQNKQEATSIHHQPWPEFDETLIAQDTIQMAVQVNGKVRAQIQVEQDTSDEEILETAKQAAAKYLAGKELKFSKIIPGKLVTLVI